MNNNPFFKQLLSEIANKANDGRMTDISWSTLNESRKVKKFIRKEAKKPTDIPEDPTDVPPTDVPPPQEPANKPTAPQKSAPPQEPTEPQQPEQSAEPEQSASEEDVDQAQADTVAKNAELEKAKAEKEKAEQEIEKNSYIKLVSVPGVHFLLGKLLDHAFKTDSIDSLAGELVQKLKIQTPEDLQAFTEEVSPFKVIPGMGELLTSMKTMATKTPPEAPSDTAQ